MSIISFREIKDQNEEIVEGVFTREDGEEIKVARGSVLCEQLREEYESRQRAVREAESGAAGAPADSEESGGGGKDIRSSHEEGAGGDHQENRGEERENTPSHRGEDGA